MATLPHNFLKTLQKETQIKPPNLSRYFNGNVTPRPDRALALSNALEKQGVLIPAEDFYLKKDQIKSNILAQLEQPVTETQVVA